ncbi:hypothetical protein ACFQE0_26020 [Methylobacterium komagatae]|uniref:Uncharacterized protein n=1 Tax=Methylobacterium komagatae TaxID=374425 RepID=A0ABW2BR51_9HYPH
MPESRIPARFAEICWNDDPTRPDRAGGSDVLVLDRRMRPDRRVGDPKYLSCSAGAMSAEWTTGSHALDHPAGVFASVWLCRDASPDAIRAALVQFAHVAECDWARQMLAAFDHRDGLE